MVRQQNIVYKILNYLINNQLNSLNYKKLDKENQVLI